MKAMDQPCGGAVLRKDSARQSSGAGFKAACRAQGRGDEAQMQALFGKLRELVPDGGERRMNKTQLLQSVIDYILDLTDALDAPPAPTAAGAGGAPTKMPLAECTDLNRMDAQVKDDEASAV